MTLMTQLGEMASAIGDLQSRANGEGVSASTIDAGTLTSFGLDAAGLGSCVSVTFGPALNVTTRKLITNEYEHALKQGERLDGEIAQLEERLKELRDQRAAVTRTVTDLGHTLKTTSIKGGGAGGAPSGGSGDRG